MVHGHHDPSPAAWKLPKPEDALCYPVVSFVASLTRGMEQVTEEDPATVGGRGGSWIEGFLASDMGLGDLARHVATICIQ